MRFSAGRILSLILLGYLFTGCFQMPESKMDEQKDPHYLAGRDRLLRRDFKGAIECFEKALEANPRSSAAHFELGSLYEEKMSNYARAIFHYERHLELNPNSNLAEVVKAHIATCKFELAKDTSFSVVSQEMQKELDRFKAEVARLKQQNDALKAQLEQRATNVVFQPQPVTPAVAAGPTRVVASNTVSVASVAEPRKPAVVERRQTPSIPSPTVAAKSHVVRSGETPAAIARRYGITVNALLAANPGLDPRRMKVGQTLKLPSSAR
jgi:LysM repeat protein